MWSAPAQCMELATSEQGIHTSHNHAMSPACRPSQLQVLLASSVWRQSRDMIMPCKMPRGHCHVPMIMHTRVSSGRTTGSYQHTSGSVGNSMGPWAPRCRAGHHMEHSATNRAHPQRSPSAQCAGATPPAKQHSRHSACEHTPIPTWPGARHHCILRLSCRKSGPMLCRRASSYAAASAATA